MSILLRKTRQTAIPRCLHVSDIYDVDRCQHYPDMPIVYFDSFVNRCQPELCQEALPDNCPTLYEIALIALNSLFMAGHANVLLIDTRLDQKAIEFWQLHVKGSTSWFDRLEIHHRH